MSDKPVIETPANPREYGFNPFCTCEHCRTCQSGRPWLTMDSLPAENTRRLLEFRDRWNPTRMVARDWDGSRGYVRSNHPGLYWVFNRLDAEKWFDAWRPAGKSITEKNEPTSLKEPLCPECGGSGCLPGSQGHACPCGAHDEDQVPNPPVRLPEDVVNLASRLWRLENLFAKHTHGFHDGHLHFTSRKRRHSPCETQPPTPPEGGLG